MIEHAVEMQWKIKDFKVISVKLKTPIYLSDWNLSGTLILDVARLITK